MDGDRVEGALVSVEAAEVRPVADEPGIYVRLHGLNILMERAARLVTRGNSRGGREINIVRVR